MNNHHASKSKKFLDLIFPNKCLGCQKINQIICEPCLQNIPIFSRIDPYSNDQKLFSLRLAEARKGEGGSRHILNKNKYLSGLIVASDWTNPLLKNLIYNFKYNFVNEIGQILGNFLVRSLSPLSTSLKIKSALVIPIPLHPLRLRWRGFNQAEILANVIGKNFNWPIIDNLIIRKKNTHPQMTIDNIPNRYDNVSGIFSLKTISEYELSNLSKRTIFLVDDVCTTGATLQESAYCLRSKIQNCTIYGLVVARA